MDVCKIHFNCIPAYIEIGNVKRQEPVRIRFENLKSKGKGGCDWTTL